MNPGLRPMTTPRQYVTAFSRGMAVIRCFSAANPVLTIAEVAKAAGLNRATARRFLHTLEADGYAGSENGRYSLRPRVLELGYAYLSSIAVDRLVHQQLLQLADQLHASRVPAACSTATTSYSSSVPRRPTRG